MPRLRDTSTATFAAGSRNWNSSLIRRLPFAFSSSGSSTEYLHLYVGLADLTKTIDNGGLGTEGEDIRTQILPYERFMDHVDSHGFKDLPLLALAHWLARHRDSLRG